MTLTHEDLAALQARFAVEEHEFLNERAYISEEAITERIETVDPSWVGVVVGKPEVRASAGDTLSATVVFRMTINGVTRDGVGSAIVGVKRGYKKDNKFVALSPEEWTETNEAEKSAATDALKRAARQFGIGRYLLKLPKTVKDEASLRAYFNSNKKQGSNVPQSQGKTPPQYQQKSAATPTAPNNGNQQKSWTEAQARAFMDIAKHHGHQPKDVQNYLNVGRLGDWKGSITDAFNRLLECAPITDSEVMADWLTFIETQEAAS